MIKELSVQKFSADKHTSQSMLMSYGLMDAVKINKNLTKLWGTGTSAYPLLAATQGKGAIATTMLKAKGNTQYTWDVDGRPRYTSRLSKSIATDQGIGGVTFELEFEDNWFIYQHDAVSPSGVRCRIQSEGVKTGKGYRYRMVVHGVDPNRRVYANDLKAGAVWALGATSIPSSMSDGNRSNSQAPASAKNQYSYNRWSKGITGNMGSSVVDIQLIADDGTVYNQWMPYEMKCWEIQRRQMIEEDLWFSQYNADVNGDIQLEDEFSGNRVPKGAGAREQIESVGNLETYADLTCNQLDNFIDRIYNVQSNSDMNPILECCCGSGFNRMFNKAISTDARAHKFFTPLGNEIIGKSGDLLTYGNYFGHYKMLNGKTFSLKVVDVFDKGITATQQREGVGANPELMYEGLPVISYTAAFIDHNNSSNGESNVKYVTEEGFLKTGIYSGLTNLPASWGNTGAVLSTRKDEAFYEVKDSYGLHISNPTTSFMLELVR